MRRYYEVIYCRSLAWPVLIPGSGKHTPLIQTLTIMFVSDLRNEKDARNHVWQQAMRHTLAQTGWTCATPDLMSEEDVVYYRLLVGIDSAKEAKNE